MEKLEFNEYKKLVNTVDQLRGDLTDHEQREYLRGFRRGITQRYHGEIFSRPAEREKWFYCAMGNPSRQSLQDGYRAGVSGDPIPDLPVVKAEYCARCSEVLETEIEIDAEFCQDCIDKISWADKKELNRIGNLIGNRISPETFQKGNNFSFIYVSNEFVVRRVRRENGWIYLDGYDKLNRKKGNFR